MKDMIVERIIAFIMGIILTGIAINSFWDMTYTAWPITQGHIATSFVKKGSVCNETVIEYSYKVGNKEYHSTRLRNAFKHHYEFSYQRALDIILDYPIGKEVKVFYDSKDPQKATLNLFFVGGTIEDCFRYLMWIAAICLFYFASGISGGGVNYPRSSNEVNFIAEDFRSKSREKF
jgi:hypothetical protein